MAHTQKCAKTGMSASSGGIVCITRTPIQPFVWTLKKKRTEKNTFYGRTIPSKKFYPLKKHFHKKEVGIFVSRMNEKKMLYSFNGEKSHLGKEVLKFVFPLWA